jgi:hypothetical protein
MEPPGTAALTSLSPALRPNPRMQPTRRRCPGLRSGATPFEDERSLHGRTGLRTAEHW